MGTEGCLTKPDGWAVVSSFGTRVGADGILCRPPRPGQSEKMRRNPSMGIYCGAIGSETGDSGLRDRAIGDVAPLHRANLGSHLSRKPKGGRK